MDERNSKQDSTVPLPYTWYFEASVQPEKSEKP